MKYIRELTLGRSHIYNCSQCEGFHNKTVSQNIPENSNWEGHINVAMMKNLSQYCTHVKNHLSVHTGENPYESSHCDCIVSYSSIFTNDVSKQLKGEHINVATVTLTFTEN